MHNWHKSNISQCNISLEIGPDIINEVMLVSLTHTCMHVQIYPYTIYIREYSLDYLPDMMRQLNKLHPAIWISFMGRLFLMAALIILFPLMSKLKLSSCLESSTKYSKASATHSSKSTIVAMYSITFNTLPSFGTGPKNKQSQDSMNVNCS